MRRLLVSLLVLPLLGCASVAPRGAAHCAWRVCVAHTDGPTGREYTAINREPVPVTVGVSFGPLQNLRRPSGGRVEVVVPPQASRDVVHLRRLSRSGPMGARVTIEIDLGSSENAFDTAFTYAVPFGGDEPRELVQGYGGDETHLASMHYSLDFAMPEGTPILAARGGVVLIVQDGFVDGGADPALLERSNLVVIAHSDGTMASYGHLSKGIRVRRGQRVREGALLGYSGATGFAGQPHLHFHVGNRMLGEPGRTLPVRLRDNRGHPLELRVGAWIEPALRR